MTNRPYERPVTRSVSALLTGSSRQRLNGFIGVPSSSDWTGPVLVPVDCSGFDICLVAAPDPRLVTLRQTFVGRCQSIAVMTRLARRARLIPIAEVQAIVTLVHMEQSEADLGSWSVVETLGSAIVQKNETSRRLKRWEARQRRKSGAPSFPEGRFRPLG